MFSIAWPKTLDSQNIHQGIAQKRAVVPTSPTLHDRAQIINALEA